MSVTWACGAPIEMKIDHGGTEITEKTLKKLKLRVSVVNDFRRSVSIFTPKAFSMRSAMSPERPALPGLSCSVPPFRNGGERMGHPQLFGNDSYGGTGKPERLSLFLFVAHGLVFVPVFHHQALFLDCKAFVLEEDLGDCIPVDFEVEVPVRRVSFKGTGSHRVHAHLEADGARTLGIGKHGGAVGICGGFEMLSPALSSTRIFATPRPFL